MLVIGVNTMKLTAGEIARIMHKLREGFDKGLLKPSPTTPWSLSIAVEAFTAVESGASASKQVLLPQRS